MSIHRGAVKSNMGHLEGCSGLAGVVKAVLALERAVIPPNASFATLNPQIDAEFFNLKFPTECIPWPGSPDRIRRASVNSFGFGVRGPLSQRLCSSSCSHSGLPFM